MQEWSKSTYFNQSKIDRWNRFLRLHPSRVDSNFNPKSALGIDFRFKSKSNRPALGRRADRPPCCHRRTSAASPPCPGGGPLPPRYPHQNFLINFPINILILARARGLSRLRSEFPCNLCDLCDVVRGSLGGGPAQRTGGNRGTPAGGVGFRVVLRALRIVGCLSPST